MNHHYDDILSRIEEQPRWFDEHAVPRYCAFSPKQLANIYARQCCLLEITCQDCGRPFKVAMSWNAFDRHLRDKASLSSLIESDAIHYGDPPNVRCCPAGPTMNSVPRRVLEFWTNESKPIDSVESDPFDEDGSIFAWRRVAPLEREIACDWANTTEQSD